MEDTLDELLKRIPGMFTSVRRPERDATQAEYDRRQHLGRNDLAAIRKLLDRARELGATEEQLRHYEQAYAQDMQLANRPYSES